MVGMLIDLLRGAAVLLSFVGLGQGSSEDHACSRSGSHATVVVVRAADEAQLARIERFARRYADRVKTREFVVTQRYRHRAKATNSSAPPPVVAGPIDLGWY
jgi:hypothetical protein